MTRPDPDRRRRHWRAHVPGAGAGAGPGRPRPGGRAGHRPPGCTLRRHRAALHRGGGGQSVRQHRRARSRPVPAGARLGPKPDGPAPAPAGGGRGLRRLRLGAGGAGRGGPAGSFARPRAERGVRPRQSPDGQVRPGRRPELRAHGRRSGPAGAASGAHRQPDAAGIRGHDRLGCGAGPVPGPGAGRQPGRADLQRRAAGGSGPAVG